ncbi:zwei Ig domain protein zig-8-like [Dermacentor andersoni]|uniref:zwei Ig domain protein zig-8-like n=1 Tax=Dermacentor andersoni TaxID=34620 RepID=UPI0021552E12|nr:hemicentin-2-like [Dermacentor andersoni]
MSPPRKSCARAGLHRSPFGMRVCWYSLCLTMSFAFSEITAEFLLSSEYTTSDSSRHLSSSAMLTPAVRLTTLTATEDGGGDATAESLRQRKAVADESEARLSDDMWPPTSRLFPSFDNSTERNVTSQLGQTAYLHCIVNNLGDKTVLWIRRRDYNVLTVGLDTYTADDRFQAVHLERSSDWALQVRYVQLSDQGLYECQVSSDPKISYFVNLTVLVAKAVIEGGPDLFIRTGSSINLTCEISRSPEPPHFVFWYHNDRMINYVSAKGEITLHKGGPDRTISRLYIRKAVSLDSGNYTCDPANAEPVSISVHVVNGEKPAAMQHDGKPLSSSSPPEVATVLTEFGVLLALCLVTACARLR